MSGNPDHRKYHPAWYRPKVSTYWWLRRGTYVAFTLREVSAIFVAWFIVYLLMLLHSVSQGAESYQQFLDWSGSVGILILNIVTLIFILIHAVTWFNLAPQAMAVPEPWRVRSMSPRLRPTSTKVPSPWFKRR